MKLALFVVVFGACSTATTLALAQPPEMTTPTYTYGPGEKPAGRLAAPKDAFEIIVGGGYTQGFGSIKSGVGFPSVATAGFGLDLELGYRADANWAVLAAGQFYEVDAQRADSARGFNGAITGQYHFAPTLREDPWLEFGAGYRTLWEIPAVGPNLLTHGFELARLRVGLDLRPDEAIGLGPVIGADLNLFLFQDIPNLQTSISSPRLSTFVFAGVQGRFDVGGTKTMEARSIATR